MKTVTQSIIIFVLTILAVNAVHADRYIPPTMRKTVSHNNAFTVVSSLTKETWVLNNTTKQKIWSMAGWYPQIFVSNDGDYVVTDHYEKNHIPVRYNLVLFTFWKRGREIRKVTLKEIVPDKSILLRTVSHYHWGTIDGINDKGELLVKRRDGKIFLFDVSAGIRK